MRNKKILQKAAKKSLSWLLILGMLVTLPETPGAISAAAAGSLKRGQKKRYMKNPAMQIVWKKQKML